MSDKQDYTGTHWAFPSDVETLWLVPRNLPYGSGPSERRCLRLATAQGDPVFDDTTYYVSVDSLRYERELPVWYFGHDLFSTKAEALAEMVKRTQALADEAQRQADNLRKTMDDPEGS